MKIHMLLVTVLLPITAYCSALDQRFSDDFFASKPIVDAARRELSQKDDALLAHFLLRTRLCAMEQNKWIQRGLTVREAIEIERAVVAKEEASGPKQTKIDCTAR